MSITEKQLMVHLAKFCDRFTDVLTEELPAQTAKKVGLRLRDLGRELYQAGTSRRWTMEQRNAQGEKIRNSHVRRSLEFIFELTCTSMIGSKREIGTVYLQYLHDVSLAMGVSDTSMYNYLSRTSWELEKRFHGVLVNIKRRSARDLPKGGRITPSTGQNIIQILFDEGLIKEKETFALKDIPTPRGRPVTKRVTAFDIVSSPNDEPAFLYPDRQGRQTMAPAYRPPKKKKA